MSLYDCHFDIIIRVEDPNGIKLNENIPDMSMDLTNKVRKDYPNSVVLPRGFKIVED